jgi:hypothetical protein
MARSFLERWRNKRLAGRNVDALTASEQREQARGCPNILIR